MESSTVTENPYVAVVAKKHRNLKKKVEKVSKLESDLKAGKNLNPDQLHTIKSLGELERSLADIESIRKQLEEVMLSEKTPNTAPMAPVGAADSDSSKPLDKKENKSMTVIEVNTTTSDMGTCTPSKQFKDVTSQCSGRDRVEKTNTADEASLRRVLEIFHICANYQNRVTNGSKLPDAVDYFGKFLLGQTSVGSFDAALEGSLKALTQYLEKSDTEVVLEVTYRDMNQEVSRLVQEVSEKNRSKPRRKSSGKNAGTKGAPAKPAPVVEPEPTTALGSASEVLHSSGDAAAAVPAASESAREADSAATSPAPAGPAAAKDGKKSRRGAGKQKSAAGKLGETGGKPVKEESVEGAKQEPVATASAVEKPVEGKQPPASKEKRGKGAREAKKPARGGREGHKDVAGEGAQESRRAAAAGASQSDAPAKKSYALAIGAEASAPSDPALSATGTAPAPGAGGRKKEPRKPRGTGSGSPGAKNQSSNDKKTNRRPEVVAESSK